MVSDILVVIPARGGSKGIPDKNIRPLGGKPLILYTIEFARIFFSDDNICVSTDSEKIKKLTEHDAGLQIPFLRPPYLATDTAPTYDVLLHALDFYKKKGKDYQKVLLLQPTTPFRKKQHLEQILQVTEDFEMVVSVGISPYNPYYSLFEENAEGYLVKSKSGNFNRRQDCPPIYYYNGSVYLINTTSLEQKSLSEFRKVKKYVMDDRYSLDIDTELDWQFAEFLLNHSQI